MSTKLLLKVYQQLEDIQYWLFPGICIICKESSGLPRDICNQCLKTLSIIHKPCIRCALPLPPVDFTGNVCGSCLIRPPLFRYCISPLTYTTPTTNLISDFKFHAKLVNSKLLGEQLLISVRNFYQTRDLPELIIPVPLHTNRLRIRGYNQALELTKILSKSLNIPIAHNNCFRKKETKTQMGLTASQRSQNLQNAFLIKNPDEIRQRSIAVIDDVVTTMSTVHEVSKVLLKHGCKEIHIWSVARTCK